MSGLINKVYVIADSKLVMKWQVTQGKAVISISDTICKSILEIVDYYCFSMITLPGKLL